MDGMRLSTFNIHRSHFTVSGKRSRKYNLKYAFLLHTTRYFVLHRPQGTKNCEGRIRHDTLPQFILI